MSASRRPPRKSPRLTPIDHSGQRPFASTCQLQLTTRHGCAANRLKASQIQRPKVEAIRLRHRRNQKARSVPGTQGTSGRAPVLVGTRGSTPSSSGPVGLSLRDEVAQLPAVAILPPVHAGAAPATGAKPIVAAMAAVANNGAAYLIIVFTMSIVAPRQSLVVTADTHSSPQTAGTRHPCDLGRSRDGPPDNLFRPGATKAAPGRPAPCRRARGQRWRSQPGHVRPAAPRRSAECGLCASHIPQDRREPHLRVRIRYRYSPTRFQTQRRRSDPLRTNAVH